MDPDAIKTEHMPRDWSPPEIPEPFRPNLAPVERLLDLANKDFELVDKFVAFRCDHNKRLLEAVRAAKALLPTTFGAALGQTTTTTTTTTAPNPVFVRKLLVADGHLINCKSGAAKKLGLGRPDPELGVQQLGTSNVISPGRKLLKVADAWHDALRAAIVVGSSVNNVAWMARRKKREQGPELRQAVAVVCRHLREGLWGGGEEAGEEEKAKANTATATATATTTTITNLITGLELHDEEDSDMEIYDEEDSDMDDGDEDGDGDGSELRDKLNSRLRRLQLLQFFQESSPGDWSARFSQAVTRHVKDAQQNPRRLADFIRDKGGAVTGAAQAWSSTRNRERVEERRQTVLREFGGGLALGPYAGDLDEDHPDTWDIVPVGIANTPCATKNALSFARDDRRRDAFWLALYDIFPSEPVDTLQALLAHPDHLERNLLPLKPNLMRHVGGGCHASLEPILDPTEPLTSMFVRWHWRCRRDAGQGPCTHGPGAALAQVRPPTPPGRCSAEPLLRPVPYNAKAQRRARADVIRRIRVPVLGSGDVVRLTTSDPVNAPLPSFEFLWLAFLMGRITSKADEDLADLFGRGPPPGAAEVESQVLLAQERLRQPGRFRNSGDFALPRITMHDGLDIQELWVDMVDEAIRAGVLAREQDACYWRRYMAPDEVDEDGTIDGMAIRYSYYVGKSVVWKWQDEAEGKEAHWVVHLDTAKQQNRADEEGGRNSRKLLPTVRFEDAPGMIRTPRLSIIPRLFHGFMR